ncbi:MAG TPA: ABC transporter permease [Terriglobales bacterium]|nr:ABC transporter permease [Terriglobales bacterium]
MRGFPSLVGGELLKIRRQPANWSLSLIPLAAVLLLALLSSGGGGQGGDPDRIARAVLDPLTVTLQVGVGIPLLVLSVRVIGQEYQLGTVRVLVARGTGRVRLLLAKLTALGITAAATAVAAAVITAGALWLVDPEAVQAAVAAAPALSQDAELNLLAVGLSLAACVLLGVFVATLGRSVAFGLAVAMVWFPLDNVAVLVLPALSVFTRMPVWDGITPYLLGGNLNTMVQALEPGRPAVAFLVSPEPQLDGAHAVLVVAAYLMVFVAASVAMTWQRDIHD